MRFFWMKFRGHTPGSVGAKDEEEAKTIVKEATGCEVTACDELPYPANPQLNNTGWPSFCYDPEHCKGRTSCPKGHACSE
jgi:hypothetical protein